MAARLSARRRLQRIEAVAGAIYETGLGIADAQAINAGEGWTFELPAPLGNTLRVEGARLSEEDLAEALALADDWRQGYFREARLPGWGGQRPGAGRKPRHTGSKADS